MRCRSNPLFVKSLMILKDRSQARGATSSVDGNIAKGKRRKVMYVKLNPFRRFWDLQGEMNRRLEEALGSSLRGPQGKLAEDLVAG